jgi:hypothetical protein
MKRLHLDRRARVNRNILAVLLIGATLVGRGSASAQDEEVFPQRGFWGVHNDLRKSSTAEQKEIRT